MMNVLKYMESEWGLQICEKIKRLRQRNKTNKRRLYYHFKQDINTSAL